MKDESSSEMPEAFPVLSAPRTAALFGFASTLGSAIAAWKAGVAAAARKASPIRWPTVENRIDRKTAVPRVPPICRKNSDDDVAVPMSFGGTAFCTASTRGWNSRPRPMPNTAEYRPTVEIGVATWSRESSSAPTISRAVPMIGKIL